MCTECRFSRHRNTTFLSTSLEVDADRLAIRVCLICWWWRSAVVFDAVFLARNMVAFDDG